MSMLKRQILSFPQSHSNRTLRKLPEENYEGLLHDPEENSQPTWETALQSEFTHQDPRSLTVRKVISFSIFQLRNSCPIEVRLLSMEISIPIRRYALS